MSPSSFKTIKLNVTQVKKIVAKLSTEDIRLIVSSHAEKRMKERKMTLQDIMNILLSPSSHVNEGELENGSYRYRVHTNKMGVVVAFNDMGTALIIVTAYRLD